jgi:TIR domain-containing protein
MSSPIEIFFSFAHEDEVLMDAVRRQLIIFDRQDIIRKWHDRKILAGSNWANEIDVRLRNSQIILLFVSPHFFESDYIFQTEMREAMRRHASGEARVIPIILRPCLWQTAPFAQIQALPRDAKAITTWPNLDEACVDAAQGVMDVVFELAQARPRTND